MCACRGPACFCRRSASIRPLWRCNERREYRRHSQATVRAVADGADAPQQGDLFPGRGRGGDDQRLRPCHVDLHHGGLRPRSEEHTSELQSLMRISYAVFCLKKKKQELLETASKLTVTE